MSTAQIAFDRANFMGGLLRLFASARKTTPSATGPAVEPAAPQPPPEVEPISCAPYNGKKILVVDDDPVFMETTSRKLRSGGYAVVAAVDCSEAIGKVRDEQPDLILLDLSFPPNVAAGGAVAWDGFVIMSWLRQFQNTGSIPIIMVSAQSTPGLAARAEKAGALALFHKPVDHEHLLEAISRELNVEANLDKMAPVAA
jgi:CheY-like chemotaxis protein